MSKVIMIGLDLAKNMFQVHGVEASGTVVVRRQLRRGQVEKFFSELAPADCRDGSVWRGTSLGAGAGASG